MKRKQLTPRNARRLHQKMQMKGKKPVNAPMTSKLASVKQCNDIVREYLANLQNKQEAEGKTCE